MNILYLELHLIQGLIKKSALNKIFKQIVGESLGQLQK